MSNTTDPSQSAPPPDPDAPPAPDDPWSINLVDAANSAMIDNPDFPGQSAALAVIEVLGQRARAKWDKHLARFLANAYKEAKLGGGSGGDDDPAWAPPPENTGGAG